eukprot:9444516-Ditylum_brightwellii.AAC.1
MEPTKDQHNFPLVNTNNPDPQTPAPHVASTPNINPVSGVDIPPDNSTTDLIDASAATSLAGLDVTTTKEPSAPSNQKEGSPPLYAEQANKPPLKNTKHNLSPDSPIANGRVK